MRYFLQFTLLWLGMLGSGQSLSDAFSSTSDASPFSPQQSQFLPVTEAYQPLVNLSEAGEIEVNWQITEAITFTRNNLPHAGWPQVHRAH